MPSVPVLDNLVAWYRWGQGITSSAKLVSRWEDASGNGNHLLQATGTNQPALQADGSILFDGVDNFMRATFTLNQSCTFYLLLQVITVADSERVCDGVTANSGGMQLFSSTINLAAGGFPLGGPTITTGTYQIYSAVFNGASSVIQLNNNAGVTQNAGVSNPGGFTLAADGTPGNYSHIQVKEVLLYNVAHGSATRDIVIDYLTNIVRLPQARRTRVRRGAHRSHRRR